MTVQIFTVVSFLLTKDVQEDFIQLNDIPLIDGLGMGPGVVRIDSELISFKSIDIDKKQIIGLTRGIEGTIPIEHKAFKSFAEIFIPDNILNSKTLNYKRGKLKFFGRVDPGLFKKQSVTWTINNVVQSIIDVSDINSSFSSGLLEFKGPDIVENVNKSLFVKASVRQLDSNGIISGVVDELEINFTINPGAFVLGFLDGHELLDNYIGSFVPPTPIVSSSDDNISISISDSIVGMSSGARQFIQVELQNIDSVINDIQIDWTTKDSETLIVNEFSFAERLFHDYPASFNGNIIITLNSDTGSVVFSLPVNIIVENRLNVDQFRIQRVTVTDTSLSGLVSLVDHKWLSDWRDIKDNRTIDDPIITKKTDVNGKISFSNGLLDSNKQYKYRVFFRTISNDGRVGNTPPIFVESMASLWSISVP